MNRESEVIKNIGRVTVASAVAVFGDAVVLTTEAILDAVNNRVPVVAAMPENQTSAGNCLIRVGVLAQLYEKLGTLTFEDGRDRFEPKVDRVIGPIKEREEVYKATTSKQRTGTLTTDSNGVGRDLSKKDPKTGEYLDYLEFEGTGEMIDGQPKMRIESKDQQSGNSMATAVTCGNKFNDQEYIHKGRAEIKIGQGPTVLPKGREIITTPAATSEPSGGTARDGVRLR